MTMEVDVASESDPYTLFVSTYAPGQEVDFIVNVYCTSPLKECGPNNELMRIPSSVPCK